MRCDKFATLDPNEKKYRQKIILDKKVQAYNQKLIEKGYNASKRKELIKIFKQKTHINNVKSKRRGVFTLPKYWNRTQIAAYSTKINTKNKLKLFYPHWHQWQRYINMVNISPTLSGLYVKDGRIWLTHVDIARNLNIEHTRILELVKMILLQHTPHYAQEHATYFRKLTIQDRNKILWLSLHELKILQHSHYLHNNPSWIKLYQRIIILYDWLLSHPWCQTIHGTTIKGQGALRRNLDLILSLEAMGITEVTLKGTAVHCERGIYDKHNDALIVDHVKYKPYPKKYVYFFEGFCGS